MSLIKKDRSSCTTRLKFHHKLEKNRNELFSTELHSEIFSCITSFDYIARVDDGGGSTVFLIALILCFFPSLLSSELVLFFTEPKMKVPQKVSGETIMKIAEMSKVGYQRIAVNN